MASSSIANRLLDATNLTREQRLVGNRRNPAKQLGIDNRVGSIDVGKDADLVIYDKYPLSDFAKVQKVLIDGTVYFDRDKEVSGLATKAAEKQKLVDKLKQQQTQGAGRGGRGGRGQ